MPPFSAGSARSATQEVIGSIESRRFGLGSATAFSRRRTVNSGFCANRVRATAVSIDRTIRAPASRLKNGMAESGRRHDAANVGLASLPPRVLRGLPRFPRLGCRQLGRRDAQQLAEPFSIIPSVGLDQHLRFGTRIWRRVRHRFGMDAARCRRLHEELIVAD